MSNKKEEREQKIYFGPDTVCLRAVWNQAKRDGNRGSGGGTYGIEIGLCPAGPVF